LDVPRPSNAVPQAAHPKIAGFLAESAHRIADAAEPAYIKLTDWRTELRILGAFFVLITLFVVIAPHLADIGRCLAP
jgi:hypothetical protein